MTTQIASIAPPVAFAGASSAPAEEAGFSFHDLISIVNPLQHIPVVSTLYRAISGDTIKPLERVAGDTLYGGVWGFVSSVANLAFQQMTGKDFGDTALALLDEAVGDSGPAPPGIAARVTPASLAALAPQLSAAPPSLTVGPPPVSTTSTAFAAYQRALLLTPPVQ
jgi:hypothetical protein